MGDFHEEEQALEKEALEAILMDDLTVRFGVSWVASQGPYLRPLRRHAPFVARSFGSKLF